MNPFYLVLNPDNTISFNRPLAHAIGLSETIIYGALVAKWYYYSEREMLDDDGWFYSTVPDLQESTSLSEKQQRVPKYIIETGINNTESGNWHIAFDEINSLFGTNLPTDADTLEKIQEHISENYSEEVADMDCYEDFDMLFYTDCCPNFIEEHEP